jgi:hypothetical protein
MKKTTLAIAGFSALLLAAAPAAEAKSGVKVGTLRCVVAPGVGLILASSKEVRCTFKPQGGRTEFYSGSTGKLGIDIGITNKSYLAWTVFAPGRPGPGALNGTYVGASAQATAGAGLGANVLVGGNNGINLQPISVQGQTGLNVAAGLGSLTLHGVVPN